MKKTLLILVSTILSIQINAQTVHGYIKDKENNPITYANVVILSSKDSTFQTGGVSDETGKFQFESLHKGSYILKCSYLGYSDHFTPLNICNSNDKIDLGTIVLNENTEMLSEITITVNRLRVYSKGGSIVTDIANSSLKNIGSAKEVMKHIPGIIATKDKYEVFGKGSPVIYINNKKMRNDNELLMLKSTDILNVEVISNPGAGYDADTRAVVKITTKKRRSDGLMAQVDAEGAQSNHFSHNEGISLSYQWNKLNIFGSYRFDRTKEDIKYDVTQTNYLRFASEDYR